MSIYLISIPGETLNQITRIDRARIHCAVTRSMRFHLPEDHSGKFNHNRAGYTPLFSAANRA